VPIHRNGTRSSPDVHVGAINAARGRGARDVTRGA